jgi:subtilisin family serine protease
MKWMILLATVLTSVGIAQSPSPSPLPSPGPKKIKVLVIDTGVDSHHFDIMYHLDKADVDKNLYNYIDNHGHGTHIAGIVLKDTCNDVVLYSCKYFDPKQKGNDNLKKSIACFQQASTMGVDMVVYAGGGTAPDDDEKAAIKKLSDAGIVIVVAAGNEHSNLHVAPYYPASYGFDNIIAVGNLYNDPDHIARISRSSNYNIKRIAFKIGTDVLSSLPNNTHGRMTGTSQASAEMANQLLRFRCEERK